MGNVTFSSTGFATQKSAIATAFTSVNDKLTEISEKNANLSLFWSSSEATAFQTQLDVVQSNISAFITKYEAYMSFLDSVVTAFTTDNQNIIDSINKLIAGATDGDGASSGDGGNT